MCASRNRSVQPLTNLPAAKRNVALEVLIKLDGNLPQYASHGGHKSGRHLTQVATGCYIVLEQRKVSPGASYYRKLWIVTG
jgi:hypothetical protein